MLRLAGLILASVSAFAFYNGSLSNSENDRSGLRTPVDEEVCFAPDEPCAEKLIKFMHSAHETLDIAIFDITEKEIIRTVLEEAKRVHVRVVVDTRQSHGQYSGVSAFQQAGIEVRYGHQKGIMHDKFTIVDGEAIETGSFNYTNNASRNNQENQIYLSKPNVVARYKERFDKMWENATEFAPDSNHT
jgi:phosphatidylserine/phosphatidylglycerophosphate/cardiolipin synthase-like enzyme